MKLLNPTPITKRAMNNMGVEFERLNMNILRQEGKIRLRLNKFNVLGASEAMGDPLPPKWYLYDLLSIAFQFTQCIVLALPPSFIIVFKMSEIARLSALHEANTISKMDVIHEWWHLKQQFLNTELV